MPNLDRWRASTEAGSRTARDLLSNLDVGIANAADRKDAKTLASMRDQAEDMLTNPATRKAFDLDGRAAASCARSTASAIAGSAICWAAS